MKTFYLKNLPLLGIAALAPSLLIAGPAARSVIQQAPPPAAFTPSQRQELDTLIRSYLEKHADFVLETVQKGAAMKEKEEIKKLEKAVQVYKEAVFKDPQIPLLGNMEGPKSLVVFVDPYCGYCKKFHKELKVFLKNHTDLKVYMHDVPIMGPPSIMAVQSFIAAKEQGKYEAFHEAIFSREAPASEKDILKIAKSLGLDPKKFEATMKNKETQVRINHLKKLVKDLGIMGTPTLIINETEVVPGYLSPKGLKDKLDEKKDPKEEQ